KAVLGAPVAGSLAERAGLRAGDWVQAVVEAEGDETPVRSFNDLRWLVTDATVHGNDLTLQVTDRQGRQARRVQLPLSGLGSGAVDARLMQTIGIGAPYSQPVMGEVMDGGPAARAGLRAGDRVLSVDGRPVEDAARLREW